MRKINSVTGVGLTAEGKGIIADAMYAKGQAFVIAAALLRRDNGNEYAVLHLLCQGIEVALKGLLLHIKYDQYKPKLKHTLGHNLIKIVNTILSEIGLTPLRPALLIELETLGNLYSKHLLRYGSGHDIFVSTSAISSHRTFRRIAVVFRLVRMKKITCPPIN